MESLDKQSKIDNPSDVQWQELYVLTEHWQSDLEFYKDDLRFLHQLVDKYFIWITKSENLELVKEIMLQIQDLENRCQQLLEGVQDHKHSFVALEKNLVPDRLDQVVNQHADMETKLYEFVKEFRANRKEVFRITEYIIDSEELTNLIKR